MKGFLVLLCAFVAVQARSTGLEKPRPLAALGENPWVVHLRLAVATGGHVETCGGSVIGNGWVLTAYSCIRNHRFIWVRYGLVEVIRPSLVIETNAVQSHPNLDLALISTGRHVEFNENISAVRLPGSNDEVPASGRFCGFGVAESGAPGESLSCLDVNVQVQEDDTLVGTSEEGETSRFDVGGALVVDGVQYGVLVESGENSVFINPAVALDWIESTTGLDFGGDDSDEGDNGDSGEGGNGDSEEDNGDSEEDSGSGEDSSSDSGSDSGSEEGRKVRFVQ